MIKLTAFVVSGFVAFNVNAGTVDNVYYAKDGNVESQVCAVAANQGLTAAKQLGEENGIRIARFSPSLYCNGQDIRDIAKQVAAARSQQVTSVSLYAKNEEKETQLCMKAATQGLDKVAHQVRHVNGLRCNGQRIETFVKRYGQSAK